MPAPPVTSYVTLKKYLMSLSCYLCHYFMGVLNVLNEIIQTKHVAVGTTHLKGSANTSDHWCCGVIA